MKVVQISTWDANGGAARAAARLHLGLRAIDVNSEMIVYDQSSTLPGVHRFAPVRTLRRRAERYLFRKRGIDRCIPLHWPRFEDFSIERCQWGADLVGQLQPYDLVNLHFVKGMFDYRNFFAQIAGQIPLVWTLHDMNPFTGGCHYDDACGRFTAGCGACPQLQSTNEKDLSREIWQRKQHAFSHLPDSQLTIVTPSRWLGEECGRSSLLGRFRVETIPYGLDLEQYQPRDWTVIRQLLDIPESAFVVLALAQHFKHHRKGFAHIVELIKQLGSEDNIYFLLVGAPPTSEFVASSRVRCLSPNSDDRFLSFIYSSADLFVMPTLADNLPNTVMESMACGTPVVAFNVGGIPDMVQNGKTGVLVTLGDGAALAHAIRNLRQNPEQLHEMARASRAMAAGEFPLERQAKQYQELYEQILLSASRGQ